VETADILAQLERDYGTFPQEALAAACAQRDAITPQLLRVLEDSIERAAELAAEDSETPWMAHFHALFLLAQFREPRAYPLAVRFARLPTDDLWDLAGELVVEGLPRLLASVYDGDLGPIQALVEDEAADDFARGAGLEAIVVLVTTGRLPRSVAIAYFAHLFRGGLPRQAGYPWDCLADAVVDLNPLELLEDLRQAYEAGLCDPLTSWEEAEDEAGRPLAETLRDTLERGAGLIDDACFELRLWDEFRHGDGTDDDLDDEDGVDDEDETAETGAPAGPWQDDDEPGVPYVRDEPKVGRNAPCPCGSGMKYKKCCGAAD
jgi:hypothetical protein